MVWRPTRGRAVGAHTRVGEIRGALWPAPRLWGLEGRTHPWGAATQPRADPSLRVPDPPSRTFGSGGRISEEGSPQPRGRAGPSVWGVSSGRGGGRACHPGGRAACGSGRIRELAL